MAYYPELSVYRYSESEHRFGTVNVGWLESGHEFRKQEPTEEMLERLWGFCRISISLSRGIHTCEFCSGVATYQAKRNEETLLLGSTEIRVFSGRGHIYAAPTLIYHYVSVHHYAPPDEFLRALNEGPPPGSREYF